MTLTYLTRARLSPGLTWWRTWTAGTVSSINARRRFTQVSSVRVVRDGVVCMMRAFGSGGRFGPTTTLSHRGVIPLLEVIATMGCDLAVVEGGT